METRIYIAGTGGQGVMLIGKSFAYGAFYQEKNVLFVPSYGGEQRGGASNCAIMLSDGRIGAPCVKKYDIVVYMNQGTYETYSDAVNQRGTAILNTSMVYSERDDGVRKVRVNATEEAEAMGSAKVANMVMLGALAGTQKVVDPAFIAEAIRKKWSKIPQAMEMNERAFARGMEIAAAQLS